MCGARHAIRTNLHGRRNGTAPCSFLVFALISFRLQLLFLQRREKESKRMARFDKEGGGVAVRAVVLIWGKSCGVHMTSTCNRKSKWQATWRHSDSRCVCGLRFRPHHRQGGSIPLTPTRYARTIIIHQNTRPLLPTGDRSSTKVHYGLVFLHTRSSNHHTATWPGE